MQNKAARLCALSVLFAGLAGASPGALAQQDAGAARACTTISSAAERLACYDRALQGGKGERTQAGHSESPPPARAESTEPVHSEPATKRETPAPRQVPPKSSAGETANVEVTIVEVRRLRRIDRVVFITDDGQVWHQTDDKHLFFPHPPFRAIISAGFAGSHFLSLPDGHVMMSVSQQQP